MLNIKAYFSKIKLKHIIPIILLSASIAYWMVQNVTLYPSEITLDLKSENEGNMQIFYVASGEDFNEMNSIYVKIDKSDNLKKYKFKLQHKNIVSIRIDPIGDFEIKSLSLSNKFKTTTYKGNELLAKIKPLHSIGKFTLLSNGNIKGDITGGDPFFKISFDQLLNKSDFNTRLVSFTILFIAFLLFLLVLFIISYRNKAFIISKNEVEIDIPQNIFVTIVTVIFAWMLFQNIYYATSIKLGIPPDEFEHYHVSLLYKNNLDFRITESTSSNPHLKDVHLERNPYFYYMLLGKSMMLNVFNIPDWQYLRYVNVLLSFLSLFMTLLLVRVITKNKWIQIFVLVFQSNVLMYVFLSSMISYDNLSNLLAVTVFLFLLRFLKHYKLQDLLMLFTFLFIGTLTKRNFLPFALIIILILLINIRLVFGNWKSITKQMRNIKNISIVVVIVFLIFSNVNLWLANNDVERRWNKIKPTISVSDKKNDNNRSQRMSLLEFVPQYIIRTEETTFGIMAHKNLRRKDSNDLILYRLVVISGIFMFLIFYKKLLKNKNTQILLIAVISYLFIVLYVNFKSYLGSGLFGAALHGRYNFPILVAFIILILYSLLFQLHDRIKILLLFILTPLLVCYNYCWFLSNVSDFWFIN